MLTRHLKPMESLAVTLPDGRILTFRASRRVKLTCSVPKDLQVSMIAAPRERPARRSGSILYLERD